MTIKSFAELTNQVHILNDLILSDWVYAKGDYEEEVISFNRHLYSSKLWFQRTSWANKRRYVLALVDDLKSLWALSMLLKSFWNCRPKDAVLSVSEPRVLTSYDQTPMDHNRTALPLKVLGQIMINDRKWYYGLEPEPQTIVLSELLLIAGGPIMWEVLRRGQMIYERQRDHQLRNLLECIVVYEQPAAPAPAPHALTEKPSRKDQGLMNKPSTGEGLNKVSQLSSAEQAQRDARMVYANFFNVSQLEISMAAWNSVIKAIRDNQKLEEIEMTFKDGSKRKIWKVNRPKPEVTETVDFIQLLPSSIGKRILSYLPKASLMDYARVNRYWAFLIDELKSEIAMRQKLVHELQKLTDLMVKHDVSLELLSPSSPPAFLDSMAPSGSVTTRGRHQPAGNSVKVSERSPGGISFRHTVVEKLKTHKIKPRPIQKLADLDRRLERRGASDENLWQWCRNVIKYNKSLNIDYVKSGEGMLNYGILYFPCPLMKHSAELPLREPLTQDPAQSTLGMPMSIRRKNILCSDIPKELILKRFNLWSRDFSSLYKVFKVASYEYPSFVTSRSPAEAENYEFPRKSENYDFPRKSENYESPRKSSA